MIISGTLQLRNSSIVLQPLTTSSSQNISLVNSNSSSHLVHLLGTNTINDTILCLPSQLMKLPLFQTSRLFMLFFLRQSGIWFVKPSKKSWSLIKYSCRLPTHPLQPNVKFAQSVPLFTAAPLKNIPKSSWWNWVAISCANSTELVYW